MLLHSPQLLPCLFILYNLDTSLLTIESMILIYSKVAYFYQFNVYSRVTETTRVEESWLQEL